MQKYASKAFAFVIFKIKGVEIKELNQITENSNQLSLTYEYNKIQ